MNGPKSRDHRRRSRDSAIHQSQTTRSRRRALFSDPSVVRGPRPWHLADTRRGRPAARRRGKSASMQLPWRLSRRVDDGAARAPRNDRRRCRSSRRAGAPCPLLGQRGTSRCGQGTSTRRPHAPSARRDGHETSSSDGATRRHDTSSSDGTPRRHNTSYSDGATRRHATARDGTRRHATARDGTRWHRAFSVGRSRAVQDSSS
jgi:hypothetical protein